MKRLLVLLALGLAGWWLLLFLGQRALLFPAPHGGGRARPADARQVWLDTPMGRTEAWYLPATDGGVQPAPLLLFAHGNGELIDYWPSQFDSPRAWGLGVLLVEYPGYGRSGGSPSQESIRHAFEAAHAWAVAQPDVDPRRIVHYGRSLGGAAVADLGLRHPPAALILESAFTRTSAFAWRYLAPPFLVRDPFDTLAAVRRFRGPTLVLHGDHDQIIPTDHGRQLAAAAGIPLVLMACGHNDCERPWSEVQRFLERAGLLAEAGIAVP